MKNEIKSEKILVNKIFSDMWFQIPEYQRPYVWGNDQVLSLLDDIFTAVSEKKDQEYFLGSFVFKPRAGDSNDIKFTENDLLDGQQRITTMFLMFAVLRDCVKDTQAKDKCQKCIFQLSDQFNNIPERPRIKFQIRRDVSDFIEEIATKDQSTLDAEIIKKADKSKDVSVVNMARAVRIIRQFFENKKDEITPEEYLKFLLHNVILIYVSTENLEDAFRLFAILNDRGIPLRNSDILKAINLGALQTDEDKKRYAQFWEEVESDLGENFDRFLSYLRTILVKEKARLSLLKEYEDKIYDPKEINGKKIPLLQKGKPTFEFIKKNWKNHQEIFSGKMKIGEGFAFDNLIRIMDANLPSKDWVPPLLRYYDKFNREGLLEFVTLLDNKFSSDWILQKTPTARLEAMNGILKEIDASDNYKSVNASPKLAVDLKQLLNRLDERIYGESFAKYILLKLDYYRHDHSNPMNHETASIEHILPQNPESESQWCKDFTKDQRQDLTDTLGNMILLNKRKNSSLGRLDYKDKKEKYFNDRIGVYANSLYVLNNYSKWDMNSLKANHERCLKDLKKRYSFYKDVKNSYSLDEAV